MWSYVNTIPKSWPHLTPGDHDLNKLESILPEDTSTQIDAFQDELFLRRFLIILNHLLFKEGVALHLKKHECPLHSYALCQLWLKSALDKKMKI